MPIIRDAHGVIIGRVETKVEALEIAHGVLLGMERKVLTIEDGADLYACRLVGEITKEEK